MKKTFEEIVLFARTGLNPRQNFKLGQGHNNYITIKNIKNNTLVIDDNTDVGIANLNHYGELYFHNAPL